MMRFCRVRTISLLFAMICALSAHAGQRLLLFKADSYERIARNHQQQSFLMVLWSLDCSPCMAELGLLGEFHQQHPEIELLFISTDLPAQQQAILSLMKEHGLQDAEQWVFSDASIAALRYAIDPSWYGELPRSYIYLHGRERQAISGRISRQQLDGWLLAIANRR